MDDFFNQLAGIEALHSAQTDRDKSFLLLKALKEGVISLEQLTITPGGWTVTREVRTADQTTA